MSAAQPAFYVGQVAVYGDLVLSPMEGFSDQPFRSICRQLGSAMSYTEFINAIDILKSWERVEPKLAFLPEERPVAIQIFDNKPRRMLEAALRVQELGPDIIDINMGCSVRSVSGRGAGAGLLRTPEKIAEIFSTLSRGLEIPVTGKIRLGWDENSRNYLQVAHMVEENGGALLAVHGRTRRQGYGGQADWDAIAEVRQALSIPVIANGDVGSLEDIESIKAHTGCPAVMIGRAAIGNPWIFSRQDRQHVSQQQVQAMITRHLEAMLVFYGPERGLILFRKHASRYISPMRLPAEQRLRLLTAEQPVEFVEILHSINAPLI